jgi:hypothetical protein
LQAMSEKETHYVLIIHGTWNPPNAEAPAWHQIDDKDPNNFCTKLNNALESHGLGRPIGRMLANRTIEFGWPGLNTHAERLKAADALAKLINEIERQDPTARIHFVAHSHGGNVVLAALERYLVSLQETGRIIFSSIARHKHMAKRLTSSQDFVVAGMMAVLPPALAKARRHSNTISGYLSDSDELTFATVNRDPFIRRWLTSEDTNRIGKLVFLGTPFLWKYWIPHFPPTAGSVVKWLIDIFFLTTASAIVLYICAMLLSGLIWTAELGVQWLELTDSAVTPIAFTMMAIPFAVWLAWIYLFKPEVDFGMSIINAFLIFWLCCVPILLLCLSFAERGIPVPDPLGWRLGSQIIFVLAVLITSGAAIIIMNSRDNFNVYFHPSISTDLGFRYPALVIHAGYMDEAILALSTLPIAYGALVPHIRALLSPTFNFQLRHAPIGSKVSFGHLVLRVVGAVAKTLSAGVAILAAPLLRMFERLLARKLVEIISSPALGISVTDFSDGVIMSRTRMGNPLFKVTEWDVTEQLVKAPPVPAPLSESTVIRYQFLWGDKEREERLKKSWLWTQLQPHLGEIYHRYRGLPAWEREKIEGQLQTTSLVLEERLRELVGVVSVMHTSYYTNPKVINGIADFISFGLSPEGSSEFG